MKNTKTFQIESLERREVFSVAPNMEIFSCFDQPAPELDMQANVGQVDLCYARAETAAASTEVQPSKSIGETTLGDIVCVRSRSGADAVFAEADVSFQSYGQCWVYSGIQAKPHDNVSAEEGNQVNERAFFDNIWYVVARDVNNSSWAENGWRSFGIRPETTGANFEEQTNRRVLPDLSDPGLEAAVDTVFGNPPARTV